MKALLIYRDGALLTKDVNAEETQPILRIPYRPPLELGRMRSEVVDSPIKVRTFHWRCQAYPYHVYEEQP